MDVIKNVFTSPDVINDACLRSGEITRAMEHLLATGNLVSRTGLGLQQVSSICCILSNLNHENYVNNHCHHYVNNLNFNHVEMINIVINQVLFNTNSPKCVVC